MRILENFRNNGHIDPDLFEVFVQQKVYLKYAQEFLDPAQIDGSAADGRQMSSGDEKCHWQPLLPAKTVLLQGYGLACFVYSESTVSSRY